MNKERQSSFEIRRKLTQSKAATELFLQRRNLARSSLIRGGLVWPGGEERWVGIGIKTNGGGTRKGKKIDRLNREEPRKVKGVFCAVEIC